MTLLVQICICVALLPLAAGYQRIDKARELFERANRLIEEEDFGAAIPLLKTAAALAPEQASIHHYLGYALWRDSRTEYALQELTIALRLDTRNAYTHYFLGRIFLSKQDFLQAIRHFEAVLATGEPVYDTKGRLGQAYIGRGQIQSASEMMAQAVRDQPSDGSLHYQLANIYKKLGRLREAEQEFATAQRLMRADRSAIQKLLALGIAVRQKNRDEVLKIRDSLLNPPAADPELLVQLGTSLGQGEFYDLALEPLERGAAQIPTSFEAHFNLGLTLARLNRDGEAESSLLKALELRPDSFEVNSVLASIYLEQDRKREAIERLLAANRAHPNHPKVLTLLGQQYLAAGDARKAIPYLRACLPLLDDDSTVSLLLIQALERLREYGQALAVARALLKMHPSEAGPHLEVGRQLAHLGRCREARGHAADAIRIDAGVIDAAEALKRCGQTPAGSLIKK